MFLAFLAQIVAMFLKAIVVRVRASSFALSAITSDSFEHLRHNSDAFLFLFTHASKVFV